MLFHSVAFLVFAVLFFVLLPLTRKSLRLRLAYLTIASLYFYGWGNPLYILLLLISGFIDFYCALGMAAHPRKRRLFLVLSIAGSIGMLVVFKYSYFLAKNLHLLLTALGLPSAYYEPAGGSFLLLPVGISFYTFQSMSYTIDVYLGKLEPTKSPLKFFAYLSLFPQLVAGPIVRAHDLLPQLDTIQKTDPKRCWDGLRLIAYGFFKKAVVADNLAPIVDAAFESPTSVPSGVFWWTVTAMFALQIYCDFSGYTDIARGLGKWMGFEFPLNFDRPYAAHSLREFWKRWHITLSTWFRDYVYIPLGGGKDSTLRSHGNLWIAMLLSGFWHGAAWNFVLWGAYHAALLSAERLSCWPDRLRRAPGGGPLCVIATLFLVGIGWVIFRAKDLGQIGSILGFMLLGEGTQTVNPLHFGTFPIAILLGFSAASLLHGPLTRSGRAMEWIRRLEPLFFFGAILASVFLRGPGKQFIYFQF